MCIGFSIGLLSVYFDSMAGLETSPLGTYHILLGYSWACVHAHAFHRALGVDWLGHAKQSAHGLVLTGVTRFRISVYSIMCCFHIVNVQLGCHCESFVSRHHWSKLSWVEGMSTLKLS
jgi:hypothetical protein